VILFDTDGDGYAKGHLIVNNELVSRGGSINRAKPLLSTVDDQYIISVFGIVVAFVVVV
jgi:hypothetical protein